MAEINERSGFFNYIEDENGNFDREYNAVDFAQYFALFVGNGVFANPVNQLRVDYKNDNANPFAVVVRRGWAFIDGYYYQLLEDTTLVIPVNTGTFNIQSSVVCTLDGAARTITLGYLTDVGNGLPRNDGIRHDLVLATITVKANSARITQEDIVDRRPDTTYCGFVKGLIEEIDVSEMFTQYNDAFLLWQTAFKEMQNQYFEENTQELEDYIAGKEADLESWIADFRKTQEDYYEEQTSGLEVWMNNFRDKQQEFFDEQTGTMQSWASDFRQTTENYFVTQQTVFFDWFSNIQGKLGEDLAGDLQNQINDLYYYYVKDKTVYIPNTAHRVVGHTLVIGMRQKEEGNV